MSWCPSTVDWLCDVRIFESVDELGQAVGTHLGHSGWRTVTQQQIDALAGITADAQWIHVDTERAADGPFGATIAHGYLTLSLVSALAWRATGSMGLGMGVSYGANKLRFRAPATSTHVYERGVELVSVTPGSAGFHPSPHTRSRWKSRAAPNLPVSSRS